MVDGLSVAKTYYCNELSVAKRSNTLSVVEDGMSNGRLLKVMSVAVHIQRRLQPRLQGSVAIAFSNGSSIVVHPFQHLQVSRC